MNTMAFLFPGQGAQAVGMGIDLFEQFPEAEKVFETADRVLGFSITDLVRNGPAEELKLTVNTQPAVVTASIAMLEALKSRGYSCEATAGHSVGEYTALYCAGVLSMEDAISLTRSRGEYMHQAGEEKPGTLSAVIGLDLAVVENICHRASDRGVCVVANINCPGQVVISGDMAGVEEAGRLATEAGASRVIPLEVSAAFHSPLMEEAARKLSQRLDQVKFSDAKIPVYCNIDGTARTEGNAIRELMKKQITSRVLWEKSIGAMMSDGIDKFIEIGPGKTLAGMLKRIDRKTAVFNFNTASSLDKLEKQMEKYMAVSQNQ